MGDDNKNTYVFIFVNGFFLEKNFYIQCGEKMSARDMLKSIDVFKKTLPEEEQWRLQAHVWGQYEFDMITESKLEISRVPDLEHAIKQVRALLG